jgi:hypothetical protein
MHYSTVLTYRRKPSYTLSTYECFVKASARTKSGSWASGDHRASCIHRPFIITQQKLSWHFGIGIWHFVRGPWLVLVLMINKGLSNIRTIPNPQNPLGGLTRPRCLINPPPPLTPPHNNTSAPRSYTRNIKSVSFFFGLSLFFLARSFSLVDIPTRAHSASLH